jgi:hypothetical protein
MNRISFRLISPLVVCLAAASPLLAQDPAAPPEQAQTVTTEQPPAHVGFLDGSADIDREGRTDAAVVNAPVVSGDRIRTDMGRAEILFPDGSMLHLDNRTTVDVLAGDLVRLLQGRIMLIAAGATDPSRMVRYQVDTPAASVQVDRPGEYRIALFGTGGPPDTELAVMHGEATLATQAGSLSVRAGERSLAREGARPDAPRYFNSARWDAFDRWSQDRQDARTGRRSAQYLPQDLRTYAGDFDRHGTWEYEPTHGNVWYPTVPIGWRPYWNGYWDYYPRYGSVWIGADLWSWPTHHYGRWGIGRRGSWFWMPGRRWASAWVHWATAPGYVSWCPLGFNDLPVIGYWGARGVFAAGGIYDPWQAWTIVPSHSFGVRIASSRVALHGRDLPDPVRSRFVSHRAQPGIGRAVPRPASGTRAGDVAPDSDGRRPGGGRGLNDPDRAVPRRADRPAGGRGANAGDQGLSNRLGIDRGERMSPRGGASADEERAVRNRFPRTTRPDESAAADTIRRYGVDFATPRRREVPGAPASVPPGQADAAGSAADRPRPIEREPMNRREGFGSGNTRRFPEYRSVMPADRQTDASDERSNPVGRNPYRREVPQAEPRVREMPSFDPGSGRTEPRRWTQPAPRIESPRTDSPQPEAPPRIETPRSYREPGAGRMRFPDRGPERAPAPPPQAAPSQPRSSERGEAGPRTREGRAPEGPRSRRR